MSQIEDIDFILLSVHQNLAETYGNDVNFFSDMGTDAILTVINRLFLEHRIGRKVTINYKHPFEKEVSS